MVLMSVRTNAQEWWESVDATIMEPARMALSPDWQGGRDFQDMLERFTGTTHWDDPSTMMAAYDRHNEEVRKTVPSERLLEWHASEGWEPICQALDLPVPDKPFPWVNQRSEWRSE